MLTETKTEPLADPLEAALGYQLRRAMLVTLTALTDSYETLGLKVSEAIIIRFVGANPGCNQSAIGRALGVKRTNMVPIVAGLEARNLLIRPRLTGAAMRCSSPMLARRCSCASSQPVTPSKRDFSAILPLPPAKSCSICAGQSAPRRREPFKHSVVQ